MSAPVPATSRASDDEIVRGFTAISIAFRAVLVVLATLGAFVLLPDGGVRAQGVAAGLALGMVSWFGSGWITSHAVSRATRPGAPAVDVATAVGPVVLRGLAVAEVPALAGFVLAMVDGSDVGALIFSAAIAILAINLRVSGPVAVRRHLAGLRA